jgi:aminocarboxymuconate-semialdehyde decarboxylase
VTQQEPVIDMHAHVMVQAVEDLAAGEEGRRAEAAQMASWMGAASNAHNRTLGPLYQPKFTDVSVRLADMDAMGVDIQAVSTSPTQYHYWAEEPLAERLVATANEHIAGFVAAHQERFVALGAVALQHPRLAVAQLQHAVKDLGLRGVEVSTRVRDRELADPAHEPFWEAAAALGAVVFIHPMGCTLGTRLDRFYLGNVIGNPAETTVALSHLVFSGVFERHPSLKVVAAHGGGYLPYYFARSDHAYAVRPESRTLPHPPSHYLRRVFFDSLVYDGVILRHLVEIVGASQVVLGTDYPFDMGVTDPLERLGSANLPPETVRAIRGANAARLLGLVSDG